MGVKTSIEHGVNAPQKGVFDSSSNELITDEEHFQL